MRSSLATHSTPRLPGASGEPWPREQQAITREVDALGPVVLLLAAFCAVIVFFPAEGRVAGPLHEFVVVLLGRATFMLPLAMAFVGVLLVLRDLRPDIALPRRRLVGMAVLAIDVAATEHLMANGRDGTGLVGEWLSGSLIDLFGAPFTSVLLVVLLGLGILLAFNVRWHRATRLPPDAAG